MSVRTTRRWAGVALTSMALAATAACAGPAATISSVTPAPVSPCRARDLALRVAATGAEMSQPFAVIVIVNRAATTCRLRGYPAIEAWGHRTDQPVTRLALDVTHGSIYERQDPGAHRVLLRSHHTAWFSVGTATAYDGGRDPYLVTRLAVTAPGDTSPVPLRVTLPATAPAGAPIPVGVTAVAAGPARRSGP